MHLEQRIANPQAPAARDVPIRRDLGAVSFSMHPVVENLREHQVGRRRAAFDKWDTRLFGVKAAVDIVKGGQIKREPCAQLRAIPELVGENTLGWGPRIAEVNYKDGRPPRPRRHVVVEPAAGLKARGGFHGAGNCRPDRMVVVRSPQQADVGLDFEPTVVVMFELRAQRQTEPVGEKRDLILDKATVEAVAAGAWIEGKG